MSYFERLHNVSITDYSCYKDIYTSSGFPNITRLCNCLSAYFFPWLMIWTIWSLDIIDIFHLCALFNPFACTLFFFYFFHSTLSWRNNLCMELFRSKTNKQANSNRTTTPGKNTGFYVNFHLFLNLEFEYEINNQKFL